MKNKGFFWSVTIALALACIYQLSFTLATNNFEKKAEDSADAKIDSILNPEFGVTSVELGGETYDPTIALDLEEIREFYIDEYLRSNANEEAHPFGFTYAECQKSEINLGLDLQGGMSVTLEISVPELVKDLAGNTRNPAFNDAYAVAQEQTNAGEGDFIDLFVREWEAKNPNEPLAKIFSIRNPDQLASNSSNEEVKSFLSRQANEALDGVEIIIEKRVNSFGVAQPTIQKLPGSNRIFVELPGIKDKESAKRKLQSTANLEFYEVYDNIRNPEQPFGVGEILYGAGSNIESELSEALFGEDAITEDKEDTLSTELPIDTSATAPDTTNNLLSDPAELLGEDPENELLQESDSGPDSLGAEQLSRAEQLRKYPLQSYLMPNTNREGNALLAGPVVGIAQVKDTAVIMTRLRHEVVRSKFPEDLVFMWGAEELQNAQKQDNGFIYLYAIKVPDRGARVDGDDIKDSYTATDNTSINEYRVVLNFTDLGSQKWGEMTGDNVGKPVAITMDELVYSAPYVEEKMTHSSSITGGFDLFEAKDLSGLLNAGALPAPVNIVDETIVGPSLGHENINSGMWSFVFAISLVLIYMIFYYAKAGIIADLALIINIFFLVGALASMKAILTLPGIAGIVLTIGMSVDANVLIFERIREELRHGKGKKGAVKDGFQKALAAILDANITTLLTGIVLATFGTGPIKGFATTLIIGIFTSFFAAVVITRLIVTSFLDKDKDVSFSTKITENWFTNTAIPFVKKRKLFYLISGAIVIGGLASLFTKGLDLGVDFSGGRKYVIELNQEADYQGIRENLTSVFEGNTPEVKKVDNSHTAMITTKYRINEPGLEVDTTVQAMVLGGLNDMGYEVTDKSIKSSNVLAPTISKDLKNNSIYAIGFSLIIIFLYILFRFRKWQYGLGALIAMAHDVVIVLSLFSIFYGILPFSMEIDQAFIAAILTVVGYSINDTVVVFDRIREYLKIHHKKDQKEVINMALNSTLSRTINTSVSTFIVLLIIFLMGGDAIKGFTFALMVGVVVGTYSSLFIATPAVIDFSKRSKEEKASTEVE
ncbi:protein translocase subunit SecDF [Paracrocinitomix mangrovi]|uniref:protein translocase subunit SecDF n=1 Tax=Paracrocinitomix mangrovi TaxID=2862509 RepID=UPI001C8E3182|nr:protein translocase subunit SecDF [Paracrocinitomix mangrovi]UKN02754.1 protein translocase subunit SecDF [Paracrocinitomix mangrovi]